MLDYPDEREPRALVVLIPGHGCTDVVGGDELASVRRRFIAWGYATALWDRAGCGGSEGTYEHHQPVQDSAREAVAVLTALRRLDRPGTETIGLWGVSRGGWIAPLAIDIDGEVDFWISVSGPDQLESFGYMLRQNVLLDGRSPAQADRVQHSWLAAVRLMNSPETTWEEYLAATRALYEDPWFRRLDDGGPPSLTEFRQQHARTLADPPLLDEETGFPVVVKDFDAVLRRLDIPVLALLGDRDSQVNWRRTRALYQRTLGQDPQAELTLRVLSDCNHAMRTARTGASREDLDAPGLGEPCPGFYPAMRRWLDETTTASR